MMMALRVLRASRHLKMAVEVGLVVGITAATTPMGSATRDDGYELRAAAVRHGITCVTTIAAAQAFVAGMEVAAEGKIDAVCLQDLPDGRESRERIVR